MTFPNIFTKETTDQVIHRIGKLTDTSQAQWGKMNVSQMLAHCCVSYEMIYEPEKHPKPNAVMRFFIKLMAKNAVVGDKPYKRNSPTAPAFVIKGQRNFEVEKRRLIDFLTKTQELGEDYYDNKESNSFGNLTKNEWNTLFYKHLDHHLTQFAV